MRHANPLCTCWWPHFSQHRWRPRRSRSRASISAPAPGFNLPNSVDVQTSVPSGPSPRIDPSVGFGAGQCRLRPGQRLPLRAGGQLPPGRISHGAGPGSPSFSGTLQTYGAMANALFDMDIGCPGSIPISAAASATPGRICGSFTVTPVCPAAGRGHTRTAPRRSFAWQAIAGLSFPIPNVPGLSLTAEYRFFGVPGGRDIMPPRLRRPAVPFPHEAAAAVQP